MNTISGLIRVCVSLTVSFLCLFCWPNFLNASPQEAVFAGGCFWCLEHDLESIAGVSSVDSGYTGGDLTAPTYASHKGHQEAVKVYFDSEKISYPKLLRSYWRNIDALDGGGQFCDRGDAYRPVIYTSDESQHSQAIKSFEDAANELDEPIENIEVVLKEAKTFWIAEEYHQNFAERNSLKYNFYRYSCGRDRRLDELWGERARKYMEWGG